MMERDQQDEITRPLLTWFLKKKPQMLHVWPCGWTLWMPKSYYYRC